MKTWPKEWVKEMTAWLDDMNDGDTEQYAQRMLTALYDIGALKELPQSLLVCDDCGFVFYSHFPYTPEDSGHSQKCPANQWIEYREVMEEEK